MLHGQTWLYCTHTHTYAWDGFDTEVTHRGCRSDLGMHRHATKGLIQPRHGGCAVRCNDPGRLLRADLLLGMRGLICRRRSCALVCNRCVIPHVCVYNVHIHAAQHAYMCTLYSTYMYVSITYTYMPLKHAYMCTSIRTRIPPIAHTKHTRTQASTNNEFLDCRSRR